MVFNIIYRCYCGFCVHSSTDDNFKFIKPKIEQTIFKETGIPVKINGDIHFSLLGKATIVTHDISLENGFVSSCEFAVPLMSIFDIEKAVLQNGILV